MIFWLSAFLVVFTYAGYPLLIALLAKLRPRPTPAVDDTPSATVVIVAFNEAARITTRIENLLASDYPAEKLHILIVSDGSTDDTAARVAAMNHPRVRAITQPARRGKADGLNAGIAAATSDIIVLTDSRQTFAPDTIRRLASRVAAPGVGAASGELTIAAAGSSTGAGVDVYWKLEKFLRARESLLDSCIGCTGAVYAIRRELFTPLPADTILDDVVIPMRIAIAGHRVIHEPTALAHDPQPLEPDAEKRRKRRTLAGNFQMLFRHPAWLLPWRNRLWWQLAAHKYLRIAAPIFLITAYVASALHFTIPPYREAFLLQTGFYVLALLGMALPRKNKLLSIPAGFVFLNLTVLRAFHHYLTSEDLGRWRTNRE